MAAAQSNRKCSACGRALSGEDEWISLDGGEVWCAECWQEQFGPEPQAAPEEEPALKEIQADDLEGLAEGEQITSDQMKNLRPCTNCGHLCAVDAQICPSCGGEPFLAAQPEPAPTSPPAETASGAMVHQPQTMPAGRHTGPGVTYLGDVGPPPQARARKTSGMAVASFVLSLCGFLCAGFILGLLAVIFGGVALSAINKDPRLGGKGLATAGLVIGIIDLAGWIALLALGLLPFGV